MGICCSHLEVSQINREDVTARENGGTREEVFFNRRINEILCRAFLL